MKEKMKQFFSKFQEGYTKKDPKFIDEYMDAMFEDDVTISVIGTGNTEMYETKQEVKELIEGDWLYWGDLTIHMDTIIHQNVNDHDVFIVEGDLAYSFQEIEATPSAYQRYIKEIIDEADEDNLNHVTHQHMKAHYVLDQFLHIRNKEKRFNNYPIVMVFVCKEVNEEYKIRALTFTNPPNGEYPDQRMHAYTGYNVEYERSLEAIKSKGKKVQVPSFKTLTKANDFVFVDVNGKTYESNKAVSKYEERFNYYDDIVIDEKNGLLYRDDEVVAITYVGYAKKVIHRDQARNDIHQRIKEVLASEKNHQDQLFIIRRELSILNKELALGETHDWPFRVFVVMEKVNEQYVLKLVQFGYPMDVILEDKYL